MEGFSCGSHECVPHYEMEDGRRMLKIKRSDKDRVHAHKKWKYGYNGGVGRKVKKDLKMCYLLLGERYEELVEMRPAKIVT